jgi:sterol desaturase/sphingolipid hydroxylase (fatty acid hydroxylase superfamily)
MDAISAYAQHYWDVLRDFYFSTNHWHSFEWFIANMLIFMPLAFVFPGKKKQPHVRLDMATDGIYWFAGPHLYGPVFRFIATFFVSLGAIQYVQMHWGLNQLPVLAQAFLILLLTDILQYWAHRAFHTVSLLWRFHSIHHSPVNVDWMTAARFHPVNIILYSTAMNALVATLGFSGEAFWLLVPFNAIYSPLVHANLNWTYGPFKHLLASPVFHRWHHTYPEEGGNKNFAPTFPFLDVMFGTFYMPKGKQPEVFGAPHDGITGNILQQLAYPFLPRNPTSQTAQTAAIAVEIALADGKRSI